MLIGLDGIPLTELRTGVGHYTFELARALARMAPGCEFELVYPSSFRAPEEIDRASLSSSALPRNLRIARVEVGALTRHWWSLGLPRQLKRAGRSYDLFHGTNFDVPLWGCPATVLTLHDLSALTHSSTHTARASFRAHRRLPLMIRRADAVITPTEAVRVEARELFGIEAEKIFAVHEAPRKLFKPVGDEEGARKALRRLKIDEEFILSVGTIEPRKNLIVLLRAFESLVKSGRAGRAQLVVAGRKGWLNKDFFAEVARSPARERINFTGYLADEDLRALYSTCRAFVYPSLYEGFGLPPVEAMACGSPVLCSRIPALEETTQGAALLFDPHDSESLALALASLLADEQARAQLSARGVLRASRLTWDATARRTLEVYEQAMKRS